MEHVDVRSIGTGGFEGNMEKRNLNWTVREITDPIFGPVCTSFYMCQVMTPFIICLKPVGKSRRVDVKSEDIEYPWLKETWLQDTLDNGAIQSYVESDTSKSGKTWIADQVCTSPIEFLSE